MTKCHLGRGLPEYFFVTSGEEITYTIYICWATVWATKTLGLAVMEIQLNTSFWTILWTDYFTEGVKGLCMTRNKCKNLCDTWKKKEISDSWIYEKVWLKAAKSVSGKWILLKFVRETWTKSPHLPCKVTLAQLFVASIWINLRSSSKRETDVHEITTFWPASDDSLFGSTLIFKTKLSYVEWFHLQFQRDGNRETSNQETAKLAV